MSPVYLALGDSMSIDLYTEVAGGGAASQFYSWLGRDWDFRDLTIDGCTMREVDSKARGDVVTLTIGGNDALCDMSRVISEGVSFLLERHRDLLQRIRDSNPNSCFIVGNIYSPQTRLSSDRESMLTMLNAGIAENTAAVGGRLADIHRAFKGNESSFLCQDIEPTLKGATAITQLFIEQYQSARNSASPASS